jgi:DNA-binding MarR family transcriptional regulator
MKAHPNYYCVIPAHVRYNNNLTNLAKLLYGEISALSNALGYCYATNSYFARLYGVTTRTITSAIAQLEQAGAIHVRTVNNTRRMCIAAVSSSDEDEAALKTGNESIVELFKRIYTRAHK